MFAIMDNGKHDIHKKLKWKKNVFCNIEQIFWRQKIPYIQRVKGKFNLWIAESYLTSSFQGFYLGQMHTTFKDIK